MNQFTAQTLGLAVSVVLTVSAFADVVPVPRSIATKKIEGAKPRNVVFILSDDHRYDAMSFMGHSFARTPHMDAMAKRGGHLKNAFVTTSLCSPSRASILTGLYTFRHRVIDNQRPVPAGTLFFPQYLQQAGYTTGFIGKWHMGAASDAPRPGFDYWLSFKGQGHYYPPNDEYTINENGKRVPQDGYITTFLTEHAIEFLERQTDREQPFFLYLSHKAVHGPFTPEQKYKGTLANLPFELPSSSERLNDNHLNRPRWLLDQRNSWHGMDFPLHTGSGVEAFYKSYCEALRSVDDSIGAVMDQLRKMGIYDDTLVIYMGDNGYMFGEHGLIDKRVAYETSSRVPLLIQCPRHHTRRHGRRRSRRQYRRWPHDHGGHGIEEAAPYGRAEFLASFSGQVDSMARLLSLRLLLGTELPADADSFFTSWRTIQVHDVLRTVGHGRVV